MLIENQIGRDFDFVPVGIVLINTIKGIDHFDITYKNNKYLESFSYDDEWIFQALKEYLIKNKNENPLVYFFNYSTNVYAGVFHKTNKYLKPLLSNEIKISDYVLTIALDITNDIILSDMQMFGGSFLNFIECNKEDSTAYFFEQINNKFNVSFTIEKIKNAAAKGMFLLEQETKYKNKYYNFSVSTIINLEQKNIISNLVINDITKYKTRLQEEMKEKNSLLRSIAKTYEFIGQVNLINKKVGFLLHKPNILFKDSQKYEDIISLFAQKYIYYVDEEKFKTLLDFNYLKTAILKNPEGYSFEIRQWCDEGYRVTEWNVLGVYENGEIATALVCFHDVSNLAKREKIINSLSTAYDFSCFIDLKHDRYYPNLVNANEFDFYDYKKHIERGILNKVHPNYEEVLKEFLKKENLKAALNKNRTTSIKFSMLNKENKYEYYRIFCIANDQINNEVVSALLLLANINKEVLKEENSKSVISTAIETAELASRTKSKFLSRMSHDLRTPLNSIIGLTSLTLKNLEDKNKIENNLNVIRESSRYLLSLINEMLDLAKIENGKMILKEDKINIEELVDEIVEITKIQTTEKKIKINKNLTNVKHKNILADKTRLYKVISNLISNAIKYNKTNGWIDINVIEEDNTNINIAKFSIIIEDGGIGMSQEFLEQIFIPFSRADDNIEGTGIGLTITKSIVNLLNGEIEVESKEGVGSKFKVNFEFKIDLEEIKDITSEEEFITTLKDKRVLLVEDNIINVEIAKEIIEQTGVIVETAYDGYEALTKVTQSANQEEKYSMVFMDVQMPRMDGYEATKRIRSINKQYTKNLIIVGMSANAFCEDIEKGKIHGMNDYLSKPVEANQIIKIMTKYIK